MHRLKFFYLLIFFSVSLFSNQFFPISQVFEKEYSQYLFLKDSEDTEWVFKQRKEQDLDDFLTLSYEVYASKIAHELNIPLNEVLFVSSSEHFVHRINSNSPGTLHRKVPGIPCDDTLPWAEFDLHQRFRTPLIEKKWGKLPFEKQGLRLKTIRTFIKHPDLGKIVALDTYLGNVDRSLPNIFYDSDTDHFFGIDMENSLKTNLAELAYLKICEYERKDLLTKELFVGLEVYLETLKKLIRTFPAERSTALFDSLIQECELEQYHDDPDFARVVTKTKRLILESYNSSIKLVQKLDELLYSTNKV